MSHTKSVLFYRQPRSSSITQRHAGQMAFSLNAANSVDSSATWNLESTARKILEISTNPGDVKWHKKVQQAMSIIQESFEKFGYFQLTKCEFAVAQL
jgi:hypothetical protein